VSNGDLDLRGLETVTGLVADSTSLTVGEP